MSRQISYFIEGGDNVGKTTLIDHITQNFTKDYKKEFTKSIGFFINKYPTKDNTEFMNVINKIKNAGAAEVINQGAKGTYFNILNPKLFNIEI